MSSVSMQPLQINIPEHVYAWIKQIAEYRQITVEQAVMERIVSWEEDEEALAAEDAAWEAALERPEFQALEAQALKEIAEGKVYPMFDENGKFIRRDIQQKG